MLLTFGAFAAQSICAQGSAYLDESTIRLPPGLAGQCMDAAAGDADNDGDVDIALAMEFRPNLLLVNDGTGRFTIDPTALPGAAHDSEDIAFADFDNDGDSDLVLVSEDDRTDELYLNDGFGRFIDASERLTWDDVSNALAVTDFDGDGAPDLLTGNIGINRVLLNDGTGRFTERTAELWPQSDGSRTQDIELADIDGDGDEDVIVANEGQNQIFQRVEGRLIDVTERALPQRNDETREIRAADLDGDSDVDLVVANVSFLMAASPQDYVLYNDGSGVFSESRRVFPELGRNNFSVQVVDLDDDGDPDILVPDSNFARVGEQSFDNGGDIDAIRGAALSDAQRDVDFLALLNDGAGAFAIAEAYRIIPAGVDGNGFDIEVADFNGDGAADLFLCNRALRPGADTAAQSGGLQRLLIRATEVGGD